MWIFLSWRVLTKWSNLRYFVSYFVSISSFFLSMFYLVPRLKLLHVEFLRSLLLIWLQKRNSYFSYRIYFLQSIYLIIFWCLQPLRLSRVYHLLAFSHLCFSILSFPLRLAAIFLSGRSRLVSQLLKSRFLLQSHKNTTNRQMEGIEYLKRLWLLILVRHPFCCIVCTALQSLLHCGGVRFPVKNV